MGEQDEVRAWFRRGNDVWPGTLHAGRFWRVKCTTEIDGNWWVVAWHVSCGVARPFGRFSRKSRAVRAAKKLAAYLARHNFSLDSHNMPTKQEVCRKAT